MIEVTYSGEIYRLSEQQAILLMDYASVKSIYRRAVLEADPANDLITEMLAAEHPLLYVYELLIAGEELPTEDEFIVEVMAAYGQLKQ